MGFGKDIFCHGIEPYNFRDTDQTVATITANVGQSTAIGPKVAIRRNRPFPSSTDVVAVDMGGGKSSSNITRNLSPTITCTHGGEPVIGTIDASIYSKNSNQDNSKYLIKKRVRKNQMVKSSPEEMLKKAIAQGKDVLGAINIAESLIRLAAEGTMTMDEIMTAIGDVRSSLGQKGKKTLKQVDEAVKKVTKMNEEYRSMEKAIGDINAEAPHQQDQLNCQDGAARTLAASTHGEASHLTKAMVEGEDEDGEEMCVVRRLTPTETSRLQGFPDDYTKIDGPDTADAPQFKAHGNSWATPCANMISTRIEMELRRLGYEGTIRYATCCSGIEAHSVAVRNLDWKSLFFSEIEPFPCRVLATHYPDTPNLGDMTQIHYDAEKGVISNSHKEGEEYSLPSCFKEAPIREIAFKEGELQVFSGGTPCFTKGVVVLTKEGYKPIENIKVGDEVLTHLGRFRKVLRVGSKVSDDLVEVAIVGRNKIVCTADHPFPLLKPHRHKDGTYYFDLPQKTHIKDGAGMYAQVIATDSNDFGVEIPTLPKVYDAKAKDIYELCGWYVGDGYIRGWKGKNKKAIILCLNHKDIEVFNSRFGGKIKYTIARSAGIFKVQICCTKFALFLHDHFGELAHGKKIPMWAYRASVREAFLKGYFQTDGCLTRKGHGVQWSTVSQALAYGVADLVGDTSVTNANVPPTTIICGRTVNQRPFYTVCHNDASNHFHKVGMFDAVKVRSVTRLEGVKDTVYNIEVDEDHTYVVNGIVTHNCQSISVAGKREGMAEGSGTRSSLAFHYQRIIDDTKPMFTIWENVPGAFSSNGGADFIWFVNKCAESGYAMAWRVLDAQWTMTEEFPRAVPQRRRRIWLVGYKGNDWRIPARICFELEKDLTANPPTRIPGLGFKTLNPEAVEIRESSKEDLKNSEVKEIDNLFSFVGDTDDGGDTLLKVSRMIDFKEMPDEPDFSKVSMAEIYTFARKIGEPGYIGSVFRSDKKIKKTKVKVDSFDLFSMLDEGKPQDIKEGKPAEDEEEDWVGAEKITPAILENIGNAGIMANGKICTMNCHEWTSGIQLSPKTYNAWEEFVKHKEWLKANDLLPEAYDETVCGLSDVLQEDPDEKYNLSWRACFGILKRAETRGKELPAALAIALVCTIRDNAGIVKWVALNGRDTKKKETDLTERESAMMCFEKYIASVAKFEDVEAVQPKRKTDDETEEDDVDEETNQFFSENGLEGAEDEGAFWDGSDNETPVASSKASNKEISKESMPNLPNGVINVSGGEIAATLIASGDAAVGTTQDANIIALKK